MPAPDGKSSSVGVIIMPTRWMTHSENPGRHKVVFEMGEFVNESIVPGEHEVFAFEYALQCLIEVLLAFRGERDRPDIRHVLRAIIHNAGPKAVLIHEHRRVAMPRSRALIRSMISGIDSIWRERTSKTFPYSFIEM